MNPWLKTLLSQLAGFAAGALMNAIDHPTGGFATTLASNPMIAVAYMSGVSLIHNLISKWMPPSTVVSTTASSPVSVPGPLK